MALFGGKTGAQLTLTEAIMIGFRMVLQPNFAIPILIIGVVLNLIVIGAITPLLVDLVVTEGGETEAIGGGVIAGVVGGLITAIIGGLILNLYGQVWATMASVGEAPTINAALARVGSRWMSILGAGIIAGVVTLAIFIVGGILGALLGPLGIVVILVSLVAGIYISARLSLAGWLAADGSAAMEAVQTSWTMTQGKLLLIIGWLIVFAIVFGIVGAVLSAILGIIPLIGPALAATIVSAFGFGSGVSLYRKVRES